MTENIPVGRIRRNAVHYKLGLEVMETQMRLYYQRLQYQKLHYQKGRAEELDEIVSLFQAAIKTMEENGIPQWDEIYPSREDLQEDIRQGTLYTGRENGTIAVVFVLNTQCDEQYEQAEWRDKQEPYLVLHRFCVHPAFQNRGVGRLAAHQIEEQVKEQGIYSLRLDAFSENPFALKLYRSLGYRETGTAVFRKGKFYLFEKNLD